MGRIRLTWDNASTTIVEQRVYRSTSPLDTDDMPAPLAVLPRGDREYLDSTIEDWLVYYYAVSSVLPDYSELISEEIKVEATPGGGDPHWDKVVALMHFDGDLTDETGRVWTLTGSPIIGGVGRFGECITFSGSSSERVSSTHPAFGTDDWTVEMWVRFISTAGQQNFFENLNSSGINPAGRFTIYQVSGTLKVFINSSDQISTPTPSTSDWHHISVSCESGIVRLFVNGEVKGSWNSGGLNFDQTLTVFGAGFGTASLFGSLDELRITKGVARYTENFTPPTEPFPNN